MSWLFKVFGGQSFAFLRCIYDLIYCYLCVKTVYDNNSHLAFCRFAKKKNTDLFHFETVLNVDVFLDGKPLYFMSFVVNKHMVHPWKKRLENKGVACKFYENVVNVTAV